MGGISFQRFRGNKRPPPQYEKGASKLLQPPQPAERFSVATLTFKNLASHI